MGLVDDDTVERFLRHVEGHTRLWPAGGVCAQWRKISARTPSLDVSYAPGGIASAAAGCFARNAQRYGSYLRWASFFASDIRDSALVDLLTHCGRTIETLVLAYCRQLTDESIHAIATHCATKLRHVILWGMSPKEISDAACADLVNKATNLQTLDLRCLSNVGILTLKAATQGGSRQISFLGARVDDESLQAFGQSSKQLKWAGLTQTDVTDVGIAALMQHCPNLATMNSIGCSLDNVASLPTQLVVAKSLTQLNISWCRIVVDELVEAATRYCPHLAILAMSGNTMHDSSRIMQLLGGTELEALEISGCSGIEHSTLEEIGRHLPGLVRLDVSQNTWQWGNNIDGLGHDVDAFSALGNGCSQLKSLCMSHLPLLVPETIARISTHCKFLKHIDLACCTMPSLQSVEPVVSDSLIHMIAQNVSTLESLLLSAATEITDLSCQSLASYAHNLRTLDVSHCVQLTDQGMLHLSNKTRPSLIRINISGLIELNSQALPAFESLRRNGLKHIILFDKHEARKGSIVTTDNVDEGEKYPIHELLDQDDQLSKIVSRMSMALTMSFDAFERDYCPNSFLKAWPGLLINDTTLCSLDDF